MGGERGVVEEVGAAEQLLSRRRAARDKRVTNVSLFFPSDPGHRFLYISFNFYSIFPILTSPESPFQGLSSHTKITHIFEIFSFHPVTHLSFVARTLNLEGG